MSRGLRKRQSPFVQVPSATIRDKRLSFRARGVLAFLLDMPDGWDVRSEVIAAAGTEGREAIRTVLHELGKHGYYRLERRRMRDGTFTMGTAVSEEPVPEWAEEYAEFDGKAVMVIEQDDGLFKVKRKDGTLADDGFGPPDRSAYGETQADDAGHTGDRNSGPGLSGSGSPGFGEPGSGHLDAINRCETSDREVQEMPPSSASPAGDGKQGSLLGDETPAPPKKPAAKRQTKQRTAEEQKRFEQATEVARWWWEECDTNGVPKLGARFPGLVKVAESALGDGYTQREIAFALRRNPNRRLPAAGVLTDALMAVRGTAPPPATRPGQQRVATSDLRVSQVQSMMADYAKAEAEGRLTQWFSTPETFTPPEWPTATPGPAAITGGAR